MAIGTPPTTTFEELVGGKAGGLSGSLQDGGEGLRQGAGAGNQHVHTPAAPMPAPWGAFSPGAKRRASSSARSRRGWPGASSRTCPDRTPPGIWRWRRCGIALVTRHAVALNPFAEMSDIPKSSD